jgi:hypothetical protein
MLIFDCTQAACEFFSRKVKGKLVSPIQPPPAISLLPVNEASIERWQLHATRFGKSNVLVAMHVETRYAMLFVGLRRNDVDGFLSQFIPRYLGGMVLMALNMGLVMPPEEELNRYVNEWADTLEDVHFFKRGDRSVQAHINDVLGLAAHEAYEGPGLPIELGDLVEFDGIANKFLRSIKGGDYFRPAQPAFQKAYRHLGITMNPEEVAQAHQRWFATR